MALRISQSTETLLSFAICSNASTWSLSMAGWEDEALRSLLLSCLVLNRVFVCGVLVEEVPSGFLHHRPRSLFLHLPELLPARLPVQATSAPRARLLVTAAVAQQETGQSARFPSASCRSFPSSCWPGFLAYSLSGISCLIKSSSFPSAMAPAMRSASNAACSSGCSNLFFLPKAEFGGFGSGLSFFVISSASRAANKVSFVS